jgi:serine acetyltransferase
MTLSCYALICSDVRADKRNPKGLLICILYRITHSVLHWPNILKPFGFLFFLYKFITEYILGAEIHWRARIGHGLRVCHGYGLVVHSNSYIGSNCILRQGVTIGAKDALGKLTPVIGDGPVIGARAVVISDVPIGEALVGNSGRLLDYVGS